MMKEKLFQESYEKIVVPRDEVRDAIRRGLHKFDNKRKKKSSLLKISSIAAALLVATVMTLSFSFPSFAEKIPIIGNIFALFEDNEKENIFENYENYTAPLGIMRESNGVRFIFTEAVYDGENITVAYTIDSKQDLGNEPFIEMDYDTNPSLHRSAWQRNKKIGDNQYAGFIMINLLDRNQPDTIQLKWEGQRIGYYDIEVDPHNMINPIEGSWAFEVTLDNIGSQKQKFSGLVSKGNGMEVTMTEMTTTPISTSISFIEKVDVKYRDENLAAVIFDYEVSDDLGNVYTVVSNGAWGNNSNFVMKGKVITTAIDEKASSITIIPTARLYKEKDEQVQDDYGIELEPLKEPFKLEPIKVPLE